MRLPDALTRPFWPPAAAAVMAIASILYLGVTLHLVQAETEVHARARVEADLRAIQALDGFFPVVSVIEMLERRTQDRRTGEYYMVLQPDGDVATGNLLQWPRQQADADGWVRLTSRETGEGPAIARIGHLDSAFPILTGRSLNGPGVHPTINMALFAVLAACLVVLMIAASHLAARRWRRRITDVNAVFEAIETDQMHRRAPVSDAGDELDALSGHVNRALDRIDSVLASQRALADHLAHELKKPLARARLALDRPDEPREDALDDARSEIDQAVQVFDTVLMLARLRASSEASHDPQDLLAMAEAVTELFKDAAEMKGVSLNAAILADGSPGAVLGSREELRLLLVNLVDNAIKFTPPGGHIRIWSGVRDGQARLVVTDTGPGLAAFPGAGVDRPFVRGASPDTPGAGLGLALVAVVAAHHAAGVHWSERQGGGARIEVVFPTSRSRPAAAGAAGGPRPD